MNNFRFTVVNDILRNGPSLPSEIAERLGLTSKQASDSARHARGDGYLTVNSETDEKGRVKLVYKITPKGAEWVKGDTHGVKETVTRITEPAEAGGPPLEKSTVRDSVVAETQPEQAGVSPAPAAGNVIDRLEMHQEWCRGAEIPMSDPTQLGKDLDEAIAALRELARQKSEAVALGALEDAMPGFTAEVVAQKDAEIAKWAALAQRWECATPEELDLLLAGFPEAMNEKNVAEIAAYRVIGAGIGGEGSPEKLAKAVADMRETCEAYLHEMQAMQKELQKRADTAIPPVMAVVPSGYAAVNEKLGVEPPFASLDDAKKWAEQKSKELGDSFRVVGLIEFGKVELVPVWKEAA